MKEKKEKVCRDYIDPNINTDPFGSYTGVPKQHLEQPVQDADDL